MHLFHDLLNGRLPPNERIMSGTSIVCVHI